MIWLDLLTKNAYTTSGSASLSKLDDFGTDLGDSF